MQIIRLKIDNKIFLSQILFVGLLEVHEHHFSTFSFTRSELQVFVFITKSNKVQRQNGPQSFTARGEIQISYIVVQERVSSASKASQMLTDTLVYRYILSIGLSTSHLKRICVKTSCLFFGGFFLVPLENFSIIWRCHLTSEELHILT